MYLGRLDVIAACLAVTACTGAGPGPVASTPVTSAEPARWDLSPPRFDLPGEIAEVSLSRTSCPGCPRDTIRLGSDGVIRITVASGAPREGNVPPIVVDMLVRYARDSGYITAAGRHGSGEPTVVTTLDVGGQHTEAYDHAGAAPAPVRGFEWMIEAAARLADWDPPPPDDRPETVRRDLCISARAELEYGTHTTPPTLHLSPLGRWPPWSARPQPQCLDTRVPLSPATGPARLPDLREVTLARGACYGECPDYAARLRADGRVFFDGSFWVGRRGVSLGRVPPVLVEMLAVYAVDTGFPATKDHHGGEMTDVSRKFTSLAFAGGRTWTTSLGGETNDVPAAIDGLEKMIDAALTMATWDLAPPAENRPADALRRLCAPVLAEARARCNEALDGVTSYIACYHSALDAEAVLTAPDRPPTPAMVARCEYLASVLPDPPSRAAKPGTPLDARCHPLFKVVRARCIDALVPEASEAPPAECVTWRERMADIVRQPDGGGSLCERHADELARDLGAP